MARDPNGAASPCTLSYPRKSSTFKSVKESSYCYFLSIYVSDFAVTIMVWVQ